MSPHDPVAIAQSLIRCQSVTPHDDGALDYLDSVLKRAGFSVHRVTFSAPDTPDVDNLYARIGTEGPNLCFAGHTDVVPAGDQQAWDAPPFAGELRGETLFGRGAVDMKGAIACFVAASLDHLAANNGAPLHGSISLLITGDEEGPSINGTVKVLEWLAERGETLDACVVGEPTNPKALGDEIKIGRRGSLSGKLVVHGRQGHVAYPHLADNPVPKLARMISRLSDAHLDEGTEHFAPSNLEVCVIGAASRATNVIPAHAHAEFNVRYNTNWTRNKIENRLAQLCRDAADDVGAQYDLSFSGTGDVFLTEPGPFVASVRDAVHDVTGRIPELTTSGGTSDARFIQAHCQVLEFGLVNATIHAINEHTTVGDLMTLRDVYRRILDKGVM
ncbi:MAG: succinyl-diaminopimelate desuccinylase [Pseudomonadota bacterium]